jgi:hypothetical protein
LSIGASEIVARSDIGVNHRAIRMERDIAQRRAGNPARAIRYNVMLLGPDVV